MKIIIPPIDLHAGQRRILDSKARFRVASCGRRFGKTMLAVEWLALMEGGAINGNPVAFFSPTYKLLLDVWSDMERTLKPVTSKANKTEMRIELITGGKIDFWTLEDMDAGRGRRYSRIVLDEAAHARYLKDAWERAIAPTLTDYRGEAWFISTPKGINYFHELFQRGADPAYPDWDSFHMPTTVNPHIPADEIEAKRLELPELVFRQEYLAEFVTFGAGDFFKREWFRRYETQPKHLRIYGASDYAVTADGGDYTEHGVFGICPEGNLYLLDWWSGQTAADVWIEMQLDLIDRWEPQVWIGEAGPIRRSVEPFLVRRMKERRSLCRLEWLASSHDKPTRARSFQAMCSAGLVYLPLSASWPDRLIMQAISFPVGVNDDMIDTCSLVGRYIHEARNARIPPPEPAKPRPGTAAHMLMLTDEPERVSRYRSVAPK